MQLISLFTHTCLVLYVCMYLKMLNLLLTKYAAFIRWHIASGCDPCLWTQDTAHAFRIVRQWRVLCDR